MVVFTILVFLLVSICVFAISYTVHRLVVRDLRHDLANKEIDSEVLKLLWEELDKLGLGYLVIEARKKIK